MAKNDAKAKKWMREVCLALPDTSEGVHYGEMVFKVGKRMFASCGDAKGPCKIVIQLEKAHTESLLASDPRFRRYPFEKTAIMIEASEIDDWDAMRALVEESYRLNAPQAPAKPRAAKARGR